MIESLRWFKMIENTLNTELEYNEPNSHIWNQIRNLQGITFNNFACYYKKYIPPAPFYILKFNYIC